MARATDLFGKGFDAMFPDEGPTTSVPWPQGSPSKTHRSYNPRMVDEALGNRDANRRDVDPRSLFASQPSVTRAGVKHYMESDEVYDDSHGGEGNKEPVVFHDMTRDRNVLLSGHHRAAKALLSGEQFRPIYVEGEPMTHQDAGQYAREQIQANRKARGN